MEYTNHQVVNFGMCACFVHVCLQNFPMEKQFTNVDLFGGKCAISRAFRARGRRSVALDLELDQRDASCLQV